MDTKQAAGKSAGQRGSLRTALKPGVGLWKVIRGSSGITDNPEVNPSLPFQKTGTLLFNAERRLEYFTIAWNSMKELLQLWRESLRVAFP
jgi:hypothetical protein